MNASPGISSSKLSLDEKLLLLLDVLDCLDIDLEGVGDGVRRGQSQPLGKRDVRHTVALVNFDPDKFLRLGSVLNVVTLLD